MLVRYSNWPTRLADFFTSRTQTNFRYGVNDCGLWTADAILAITGTDLAESFRGRYQTRKELLALIKAYAAKRTILALTERVTSLNKMPEISPLRAQRGDLVLLKRSNDYSLALVGMSGTVVGVSADGFTSRLLTDAFRAWRV